MRFKNWRHKLITRKQMRSSIKAIIFVALLALAGCSASNRATILPKNKSKPDTLIEETYRLGRKVNYKEWREFHLSKYQYYDHAKAENIDDLLVFGNGITLDKCNYWRSETTCGEHTFSDGRLPAQIQSKSGKFIQLVRRKPITEKKMQGYILHRSQWGFN